MRLIHMNSHRGIINLLADKIVQKINKTEEFDTIIQVSDCENFLVVNGLTSSNEVLNIGEVKDEFIRDNQSLLESFNINLNIIDLIKYDSSLIKKSSHWFRFYDNISRPIYHTLIEESYNSLNIKYNSLEYNNRVLIELDYSQPEIKQYSYYSPLVISSEFPYGYSLSMGRLPLYYSEYICNQLFGIGVINPTIIDFKFTLEKDNNNDFDIVVSSNSSYDSELKSAILDVFDFDLLKFKSNFKNYDFTNDITDPFGKKAWLTKDKIKDLIIF